MKWCLYEHLGCHWPAPGAGWLGVGCHKCFLFAAVPVVPWPWPLRSGAACHAQHASGLADAGFGAWGSWVMVWAEGWAPAPHPGAMGAGSWFGVWCVDRHSLGVVLCSTQHDTALWVVRM